MYRSIIGFHINCYISCLTQVIVYRLGNNDILEDTKMPPPRRKMRSHPNTYLAGNIVACFLLWSGPALITWSLVSGGWLRLFLLLSTFVCVYIFEYQYLTGIVSRVVERVFPHEEETRKLEAFREEIEQARRRGHW